MQFSIIKTLATYKKLLDTNDTDTQEMVFKRDLIQPFQGLADLFGGDGLAVFASWGMSLALFNEPKRPQTSALIDALEKADAVPRMLQALERGRAAFEQHITSIPLNTIIAGLYIADMSSTPWNRGYTGFGGVPGWIMVIYGETSDYNLSRLEAATVHELHHNIMGAINQAKNPGATSDWNSAIMQVTVGDYLVGEGLAESFSAELYGKDKVGPWVSDFDVTQLDKAKSIFRDGLSLTGFQNIQRYLYGGQEFGLHPTAGYALGFYIVQAYLERSGQSVVEASMITPDVIIAESRFFG